MSIGELCNREVVIACPEENLLEAARLMRRYHVGDLIVVESAGSKVPVGILTDRDIVVEVVAQEVDPANVSVADVMSQPLFNVREGDDLTGTVERMRHLGVRRAPVVDESGTLVGIFTLDDILEQLAELLTNLVSLTGRERKREADLRQGG
ncbi:MAG: CBS domain-containing protein [Thiogranum sp.]|jgi:CBS domain-containing protein